MGALARDAVRARYAPPAERALRGLRDDAAVEAARALVDDERAYRRALGAGAKSGAAAAKAKAAAARPIAGYDAAERCLPLQTCDASEYIYVTIL